MNEHEVYPNAPVVVATVEIRHTETPTLTPPERKVVKEALAEWTPIQRSSKQFVVSMLQGPTTPTEQAFEEFPRYFSRDSMLAISFRKEAVVVEATQYAGWLTFRTILAAVVSARSQVGTPDAVERVGIRYINEVRPGQSGPVDWSLWLDSNVLWPLHLNAPVGLEATQWQGQAVFGPSEGRSLVLRYAPGEGQAVDLGLELVRPPNAGVGPFMWIDIDSFWAHQGTLPEFDLGTLLTKCDDLHTPLRSLFESLITPKLRDEVLRSG